MDALLSRPLTHVALGVGLLLLDLVTGRYLQFPILFVIPVCLAAWYCADARWSYALAVALPLGRAGIASLIELPSPLPYILGNAAVRIAVLALLAYFVARTARQTRELRGRVDELVKMCAWSRTVEYQGEWLSFEEYLKRRFQLDTTHGIAPEQSERLQAQLRQARPER
jgi:hypothetical protein